MGGSFNLYWQPEYLSLFRSRLVSSELYLAAPANVMPAAIAHCGLDAFFHKQVVACGGLGGRPCSEARADGQFFVSLFS